MQQYSYPVGISIGVVGLLGQQAKNTEAQFRNLLKQANNLMYEVKRTQKNDVWVQAFNQTTKQSRP